MKLKLVDSTRGKLVDFFFIFSMIIFAANASAFARGLGDYTTIANLVGIIISFLYARRKNIAFNEPMLMAMFGVFTVYAIINSIVFNHFSLTFFLRWYSLLFITFVLIRYYGKRLFVYYETIVVFLCFCSIVIWVAYLIQPGLVRSILTTFRFSQSYSDSFDTVNAIIYTLNDREAGEFGEWYLIDRNAGFAWEPGAFSSLTCFAIFCNALRTNLSLRGNKSLWIFILALITSQSTTGVSILLSIWVLWLFANGKFKYGVLMSPVLLYAMTLPFMGDKISSELVTVTSLDNLESLNRFQSFQVALIDFKHYPILGYGGGGQSYLSSIDFEGNIASGIGILMSQFGILMTILVFLLIGKSSKYYDKIFQSKNGIILWAVIIGLMISYHIWNQPIIMAFWMGGALMSRYSNEETV